MNGFKLLSTERDGRIIRHVYARELGAKSAPGCLVLVSTAVYENKAMMPEYGTIPSGNTMSTQQMIEKLRIEHFTETVTYVPNVKIGPDGLEPIQFPTPTPVPTPDQ